MLSGFSRRHHLPTFSQKLRCRWEQIWRKVIQINYLKNISSYLPQIFCQVEQTTLPKIQNGDAVDE
jgi:hypothetical protein